MGLERLQKILSAAGVASRRLAETLIVQGRVTVNGRAVTTLGAKADPERDDIRVDGRRLPRNVPRRTYLVNKPRGVVCTRSDPQGRPTIVDLLARHGIRGYLYPVGRLDYDSEGVLLVTNDGDLAARLMHPRHGIEREYRAEVRGVPDERALDRLRRGIVLDGRRTAPAEVRRLAAGKGGARAVLTITLREGRSRQVRRMCEAVGHPVVRLRRVRIGPIRDERLKPGDVRPLTPQELARLRQAVSEVQHVRPERDQAPDLSEAPSAGGLGVRHERRHEHPDRHAAAGKPRRQPDRFLGGDDRVVGAVDEEHRRLRRRGPLG